MTVHLAGGRVDLLDGHVGYLAGEAALKIMEQQDGLACLAGARRATHAMDILLPVGWQAHLSPIHSVKGF